MDDSKGVQLGAALLLFWLAGLAFFTAFHPGGVSVDGQPARNPVDVLKWLLTKGGEGAPGASSTTGDPSGPPDQTGGANPGGTITV